MILPDLKNEIEYWEKDILVCGIDEVGRGCLAGPIVAAAIVLPKNHKPVKNVRDSKKLTPKMRKEVCEAILENCQDFGIGLVSAKEIDELGIERANKKAMKQALAQIKGEGHVVLIDGNKPLEIKMAQKTVIKGDATVYTIAAASIIAKVFRDQIVSGLEGIYPEYGFAGHKGYHSKPHAEAIRTLGPTPEHRMTFIRNFING